VVVAVAPAVDSLPTVVASANSRARGKPSHRSVPRRQLDGVR
jgi:hypothetical protein